MSIILVIAISFFVLTKKIDFLYNNVIEILAPILLILFVFGVLSFIISKKGLLTYNEELYKAYFIFGILILKRKVDFDNKPIVSILKLRRSQKLPSTGIVFPSGEHSFYKFYICLLNKSHTSRTELINLKKEENANEIINFLTKNVGLKFETYSPNFD